MGDTQVTTTESVYWDPFDTEIDSEPYEVWRRMRDRAPLYRNDRYNFWALSRYADVEAAHRDPATFVSSHGTVLEMMTEDPFPSGLMIFKDPPEHTRMRAMVSRAFTPRRVSALEAHIQDLCGELLAPWQKGHDVDFDFVVDFGAILPSMVICELMGVPPTDRSWVKETIDTTFHIEPGVGIINDVSLTARIELDGYLTTLVNERTASPGDDLLSGLTEADLSLREIVDFANLLISAGTETVARLLGFAAVVLDENPEQRAELAADPSLLANAVEELLRYEPPSPVQGRWTTKAVVLHGVEVPANSRVLLLTGSAGRDERKYPDPDRFDIHRDASNHVSFGFGIHFCLGAALARLEGRVGLQEVLRRHPTWVVDRERAVRLHTSTVRGWSSVPVR
jgi:cytochrome P450